MMMIVAWVMGLSVLGVPAHLLAAGAPAALLRAAAGTRLTDVRTQSVVIGDFKADASYAFTTKDARRVSGHVIARQYPLAEAPAIWVQDANTAGAARAFLPTAHGLIEVTVAAAGGPDRLREQLRWRRPVSEPGAGLPRHVGEPLANGVGYRLRSAFQSRYRALTQAASTTYIWVAGGQLHVVTHWVSKARAATEATALLRLMEHLLPRDWPDAPTPTQLARNAVR